jgi:MoaA/NifB/PqqE/SkfB family radical SAM enzyme
MIRNVRDAGGKFKRELSALRVRGGNFVNVLEDRGNEVIYIVFRHIVARDHDSADRYGRHVFRCAVNVSRDRVLGVVRRRFAELVSVLSIEGDREITDGRRGEGIYDCIEANMNTFKDNGMIFGASITVTTENYKEVTSPEFIEDLMNKGCKLIIYVEFVPVTEEAQYLAPGDPERVYVAEAMDEMRRRTNEIVLLSFPGDELSNGGCMAAGRGFFHINSHGGAEPCPFSPYSDVNVRNTSLRDAMHSPLFSALRDGTILLDDHDGGCVLYEKHEQVEKLLAGT